jgi:deoxyribonuclease V
MNPPWILREPIPKGLLTKLEKKQNYLREKIVITKLIRPVKIIAGCDSAFHENTITSVFVLFTYPDLQEIEVVSHTSRVTLPYIPGFLAFREIPNLLKAYKKLQKKPDLIMVDGQGVMHPRRMGIATHLGILLNIPTIGVAKSKLIGIYKEPAKQMGSYQEVHHQNELVGYVFRSKEKTNPLFISPGHLCDFNDALTFTQQTLRKHKLPEPTRIADLYSKKMKLITQKEEIKFQ